MTRPPDVAGRPGPADEANTTLGIRPDPVAGERGPADESNPVTGTRSRPVAGEPGPAEEAMATVRPDTDFELGPPQSEREAQENR